MRDVTGTAVVETRVDGPTAHALMKASTGSKPARVGDRMVVSLLAPR